MGKVARIPIRVVFYRDEDDKSIWIAHCLEFDLMGDGSHKHEAMSNLALAIIVQLENTVKSRNFQNLFTSAPAEYQMMYAQGREIADAQLKIDLHINDFTIDNSEVREFEEYSCNSEVPVLA